MLIDERKTEILEITKGKTYVSVDELAKMVFASPATIRRDLADLANAGLIKRVRGGASALPPTTGEVSSIIRRQSNIAEKKKMAQAALQFLHEGESYFFDSSTTVAQLIPLLKNFSDITIITNGFDNAAALSNCANFSSYMAPGIIAFNVGSSIGPDTVAFVSNFTVDTFIFSCRGFSLETGPSEGTVEQQRVKSAMARRSKRLIAMIDHTKFDRGLLASDCRVSDLDVLVTDQEPSEDYKEAFRRHNVQLVIAS